MKTPLILFLMAVTLTNCGTKSTTDSGVAVTTESVADPAGATDGPMQCYALITNGDTVRLSLTKQGSDVSGTLYYQLIGKDRNTGNLRGQMRGDTLLATYTFQSEGRMSMREVAFLAKDGGFVEGYGPVRERNGRMVFLPDAPLTFEMSRVLTQTDCSDQ